MTSNPGSGYPLRDQFMNWQCRLRQQAMRREGGRPSPGARPRVSREDGTEIASAVTVLLVEKEPGPMTDTFRHIVRKNHDPRQRYREGLRILASTYYQDPARFADTFTALFPAESTVASILVEEGRCVLHFWQAGEGYEVPCAIEELGADDSAYQATYWHNYLFNPNLPRAVRLLAFAPDWSAAKSVW